MNQSQQRAVEDFKRFLQVRLNPTERYGDAIVEFEVTPTDYGTAWIKATTEMTALPEGNLLRALDKQYWFVSVGKRGALTAKQGPKHFKQFKGRKVFGMNFDF